MSGVLFVVCVPTSKHEAALRRVAYQRMNSDKNNRTSSQSRSSPFLQKANVADLKHAISDGEDPCYLRSKSADCVRTRYNVAKGGQALFIGPWCVDPGVPGDVSDSGGGGIQIRVSSRDTCVAGSAPTSSTQYSSRQEYHGPPNSATSLTSSTAHSDDEESMEKELSRVLDFLGVKNAVWCLGKNEKFYRVTFSVHSGKASEEALRRLAECGIGERLNSVVSVIPCALYYQGSTEDMDDDSVDTRDILNMNGKGISTCSSIACGAEGSCSAWESFVRSVRARITVAQVVEGVRANATFNFDFVILLVVASIVAALGLLENNTLILAASMLISPLMGPVMAATFGTMLRDSYLRRMGVVNELSGLLVCVFLGFAMGLTVGFIDQPWPTEDMQETQCVVSLLCRGHIRSLWVNVAIALLSGAAIAISLMRGNTGSLVGVAISASLMPPAVNAGLLWAMSVVHWSHGGDAYNDGARIGSNSSSFQFLYSNSLPAEFAVMGGVSLCLTVVNIVFIYLTGIIMLKIKEVSPVTSRGPSQQFWRHDVKIARDYNITMGATDGERFRQQTTADIMSDFQRQSSQMCGQNVNSLHVPNLESLVNRSFEREEPQYRRFPYLLRNEATWSPSMSSIYLDLKKLCRIARRSYDFTHLRDSMETTAGCGRGDSSRGRSIDKRRQQYSSKGTDGGNVDRNRKKLVSQPLMPTIDGTPVNESCNSVSNSSFLTCFEANTSRSASKYSGTPSNDLSGSAKKTRRFIVTPAYDTHTLTRPSSSNSMYDDTTLNFERNVIRSSGQNQV